LLPLQGLMVGKIPIPNSLAAYDETWYTYARLPVVMV
jgi:hypothetical protein